MSGLRSLCEREHPDFLSPSCPSCQRIAAFVEREVAAERERCAKVIAEEVAKMKATLAAFLEAAGWKRQGICASPFYDTWIDPMDKHGRPWMGIGALVEEFLRREPSRVAEPTAPAAVEPPPPAEASLFGEEDVPW